MFFPTFKLKDVIKRRHLRFNFIQVGAGGNGGFLAQRLSKFLNAMDDADVMYTIIDGDQVEEKNLLRQPFIDEDLFQFKAQVLAERYGTAYGFPIFYRNSYVESAKELSELLEVVDNGYAVNIPVLIGCVDNNATRQILHEAYSSTEHIIYIDSGVDGINLDESPDKQKEDGYSGQVVCGVKLLGKEYIAPVGVVYPNILEDKDSRLPTQACGEATTYFPQRMQTNEMAALVIMGYIHSLSADLEILSHYTNFNARTMLCKPSYFREEFVINE